MAKPIKYVGKKESRAGRKLAKHSETRLASRQRWRALAARPLVAPAGRRRAGVGGRCSLGRLGRSTPEASVTRN